MKLSHVDADSGGWCWHPLVFISADAPCSNSQRSAPSVHTVELHISTSSEKLLYYDEGERVKVSDHIHSLLLQ